MTKFLKIIIVLSAAALLLSLTALMVLPRGAPKPDPLRPDQLVTDVGLSIPEFSLTDQDGEPFTRNDLLGHITVMSFIFTHCPNPCPIMTGTMADLGDKLAANAAADVRLASISVDPAHDTPSAMREYGERYDADFSRWTFATGYGRDDAAEQIRRLVGEGLKFALEQQVGNDIPLTAEEGGGTMTQIIHPSWFVLVGPRAEVLGLYRFDEPETMNALARRAKAAARAIRAQ